MHTFGNIFEIFSISLLLLASLCLFPLIFSKRSLLKESEVNPIWVLSSNLNVMLGVLTILMYELGIPNINLRLIFGMLFGLILVFLLGFILKNLHLKLLLVNCGGLLIISTGIGLWNFLPGLFLQFQTGSNMGMVTRGNNDVAYYVDAATAFINSGFHDNHHIYGVALNQMVQQAPLFSPEAILAMAAGFFHLNTWQVATPVSVVGLAFATLGIARLCQTLISTISTKMSLLIASIVILMPMVAYISDEYFLGEIFALGTSAMFTSNLIEYVWRGTRTRQLLIEITTLTIFSLFTYPEFLIPYLFLTLIIVVSAKWVCDKRFFLNGLGSYLAFIILGFVLCSNYLIYAWRMSVNASRGTFGWPFPPISSLAVFLSPQLIGYHLPNYLVAISWVTVFLIMIVIFWYTRHNKYVFVAIQYFCYCIILAVIIYIFHRHEGFGAYRSWKLIAYTTPIVYTCILAVIFSYLKRGRLVIVGLIGLSLSISIPTWGQDVQQIGYSNIELEQLSSYKPFENMSNLNVSLKPYFESMAAAAIISHPKIYLNTPTYLALKKDPTACTLVRLDDTTYQGAVPINSIYGIFQPPGVQCGLAPLEISLGQQVFLDSKHSRNYWSGWSLPEQWGTWSDARDSDIYVKLSDWKRGGVNFHLNSRAFLFQSHNHLQVSVLVNGQKIGALDFKPENVLQVNTLFINPHILTGSNGKLNIQFRIKTPQSPLNLGMSSDPRLLGIGVSSFDFEQK